MRAPAVRDRAGRRPPTARGAARSVVAAGSCLAAALTVHTAVNLRLLRRPPSRADVPPAVEFVSVLLPVRDEAARVGACVRAVLASMDDYVDRHGRPLAELVVCDDGSTDATAGIVASLVAGDARVRLVEAGPLPPGWLGKPHACARLAAAADPGSSVLAFIDADVVLEPGALARSVALLRTAGLDLVCPYPRELARGAAQRLVQPLLQWSWATTLPLRLAERSRRPSLAAANGQLLLVDAAAYARAGGHAAVRGAVLEDLELLRALKRAGGSGGVVDGTGIATCAMYDDGPEMVAGYTKSLWAAFGSPGGAAAVTGLLGFAYVLPALGMLAGSPVGAAGYLAGVAGRLLVARRTGGRTWPDCLAHPVSVLAFTALVARSLREHRRGTLTWRGRPVAVSKVAVEPAGQGSP